MDRRRFIEVGGAGSLTVAALPQLVNAEAAAPPPAAAPVDVDACLATLDAGLSRIDGIDMFAHTGAAPDALAEERTLARGALRALYASALLSDLPLEAQVDARVQARLHAMAPEIDGTMDAMIRHLQMRTSSEWADLQAVLRHRSDPADELSQILTDEAALIGLKPARRRQTHMLISHAARRLRSQPGEVVLQEYVAKIEKVIESSATDEKARRKLAARALEGAFWQDQEYRQQPDAQRRGPRGLKTLGWGLGLLAGGAILVAAGGDSEDGLLAVGLVTMTVGAIMLLVGLIQLMVTAGRR